MIIKIALNFFVFNSHSMNYAKNLVIYDDQIILTRYYTDIVIPDEIFLFTAISTNNGILLNWESPAIADAGPYHAPAIDQVVKCQNHPCNKCEQCIYCVACYAIRIVSVMTCYIILLIIASKLSIKKPVVLLFNFCILLLASRLKVIVPFAIFSFVCFQSGANKVQWRR